MRFVEVLKECENANGAGSKKVIQAALAKLDEEGQDLMKLALDPYIVFGVKKFDRPSVYATKDDQIDHFMKLCTDLANRTITGNDARSAVTEVLSRYTDQTSSYLERVLDKDPRAGFSDETYNKVWKDNQVPVFSVMLADKCESTEDFEKYITFPCQADFKYDGQRTIAIVRDGLPIEYRARSGKPSEHLNGLFDEDLTNLRTQVGFDFILDGEAFAKDFTETINAKKAGNDEAKGNLKFRAFFLMPLTDWIAQKTTITMRQNRAFLEVILPRSGCKKVMLTEGREVKDFHDMTEYCNEAIDIHKVEGLILKDWDAVYTWDRTFAWTKVKRFYDVDARFVSFYPGRPKSRLADTVGGANCVAFLESGERVEFNVGSGFSDKQRADMKANPEKWLAKTHVIKYQEVSRSKSKAVASLRFCTYEHSRDDKLVEI
jgi:DNA ligase-1